jgi:hypothetical protein
VHAFAAALEPFARDDLDSSPLLLAPTDNLGRDAQLQRERGAGAGLRR